MDKFIWVGYGTLYPWPSLKTLKKKKKNQLLYKTLDREIKVYLIILHFKKYTWRDFASQAHYGKGKEDEEEAQ